jgi:uncharacterized protein YqgV (UPF0045/DUF77 family)
MAILEICASSRGGSIERALAVLRESGLRHQARGRGILVEGDSAALFAVVERVHEACFSDSVRRVFTLIRLDDRRAATGSAEENVPLARVRLA